MTRHLSPFLNSAQKKPYNIIIVFIQRKFSSFITLIFSSDSLALVSRKHPLFSHKFKKYLYNTNSIYYVLTALLGVALQQDVYCSEEAYVLSESSIICPFFSYPLNFYSFSLDVQSSYEVFPLYPLFPLLQYRNFI